MALEAVKNIATQLIFEFFRFDFNEANIRVLAS
jgi:hypothetical protein